MPDVTVYQRSPDVVSCMMGEGAALLDTRSSTYFTMNEVGSMIWDKLDQPAAVHVIVEAVAEQFDTSEVSPSDIEADVKAMLEELSRADLVTVSQQ
jgi:hypothetical protein